MPGDIAKLVYRKEPWTGGYSYEDEFIRIEQTYIDEPEEAECLARVLLQLGCRMARQDQSARTEGARAGAVP
jgi:hypothetical protein